MLTDPLACNDISPEAYAPPVVPGPVILNRVIVSVSVSVAAIVMLPLVSLVTVALAPPIIFASFTGSPRASPPGINLIEAPPEVVCVSKS